MKIIQYEDTAIFAQLENIASETRSSDYDYSCSMLQIPEETKDIIQSYIRRNIEPADVYYGENESESNYGIEYDSHITVIYGYTANNIDEIAESFDKYSKDSVSFTLGKIGYFSHKMFYVLYIEVKQTEDLKELHRISSNSGLEIFSSYPVYTPHVTLAYILPNAFKKYRHLIKDDYFEGLECSSNKLKISTADGKIGNYIF